MSSSSTAGSKRSRAASQPSPQDGDSESTRHKRARRDSSASALANGIPLPSISNYPEQAQEEGIPRPEIQPHPGSSSEDSATDTDQQEMVITGIRATDIALGLRRLPAGFYTLVRHTGREWETENKRSSVHLDVVEWTDSIPIPLNMSATVCLEVYASFECQSMLGAGEQLRKLTVTVKQLLDRSAGDTPFMFFPKEGDVVSPCSSISITVQQLMNSPIARVLLPHRSSVEPPGELEVMTNQGHGAFSRYKKRGERCDLEQSVARFERAHSICPLDHPCRAAAQSNLAMVKFVLCQVDSIANSLEIPLSLYRDALRARPVGHVDRSSTLLQLAAMSFARYEKLNDETEGALCETLLHEVLELSSGESYENRGARVMLQLCAARQVRWDERSSEQNLRSGLVGQDPRISSVALLQRYERYGKLDDLEQGIKITRDFLRTTTLRDDNYLRGLCNLGGSLAFRFERLGELHDLDDAICALKVASQLAPHGHPAKVGSLNNLGNSLLIRFSQLGELGDLNDGISTLKDVVHLTPSGHPEKPKFLSNLATCFHRRFERFGELRDLDDCISTLKDSVQLTPSGHPNEPMYLSNLGNSLRNRFERLAELRDLDDAISTHRDAVRLTAHDHPGKPMYLNNLGNSLRMRFEFLGELRDLDDAISAHKDAVQLTPYGHLSKPSHLNGLSLSFTSRFKRLGELRDLDNAILHCRTVIQLTPHGHPNKPAYLSNLGNSLSTRFECFRELYDLNDAISTHMDALQLTPNDHPLKPSSLSNLSISLLNRFRHLGKLRDLDDAISRLRDAVQLTPRHHPNNVMYLNNLGQSLLIRFEHFGELHDVEGALSAYSHAAFAPFGRIRTRFNASKKWIECARHIHHHSLLRAYFVAIGLLPQLAWIGLSLEHRYAELTQAAGMVQEAAAAALHAGLPDLAVEWLERGRSIVWGDLFQLRSSYEELVSAHPDHARRLQNLSITLDLASATREKSLSVLSLRSHTEGAVGYKPELLQQDAGRHSALAIERDNLIKEIRRLPGFDGFLRYKRFSQLRASAHAGPVVILNAAESRCDALIVLASVDHAIHVPLPNFTLNQSLYHQNVIKNWLTRERDAEMASCEDMNWQSLLSNLWKDVVKPVMDAVALSIPGDLFRVFWCPTGSFAFLPIHAAGCYDVECPQPGQRIFDFVISSYIPSLSILTPSPGPVTPLDGNVSLLAVHQPESDGLSHLRGVSIELKHINDVIETSPSPCVRLVEPTVATVEEVLSLMKEANWAHFACHGIQDGVDSGLCLADKRRLRVRDIIALSRPRGGLAFLSACQTAMGDKRLPDEALHITAGMLYAGFEGVIGTMWSISDRLAPIVARDVYKYLLRNGTKPDSREAARALHEAIGRVRGHNLASFDEWIPFIHVGL